MTFAITKDFTFAAAHHLAGLPPEHQCSRLHGHNYLVRVELTGPLDERGFVYDYGDLAFVGQYLDAVWDHRDLNEAVEFNPTAELLARHLYALVEAVVPEQLGVAVGVSETPKSWAWYRP